MPSTTDVLETRVAALEAHVAALQVRVAEAEDERLIRELLARYGYAADASRDDEWVSLWADDGVMDLSSTTSGYGETPRRHEGRAGLEAFITDPRGHHDPLKYGNRMHVQGNNFSCQIDGEEAIATSYSIVLLRKGDGVVLDSAGNNTWLMRKIDGVWRIQERRRRHIGGAGYDTNVAR
jgi:hypothetical protein